MIAIFDPRFCVHLITATPNPQHAVSLSAFFLSHAPIRRLSYGFPGATVTKKSCIGKIFLLALKTMNNDTTLQDY